MGCEIVVGGATAREQHAIERLFAAREATFSRVQLERLLKLGKLGIDAITERQRRALGANWPLD